MIAVIDQRLSRKCRASLEKLGYTRIPLLPFSHLAEPVASHPDMLILPLGERLFVHTEYYKQARETLDRMVKESGLFLSCIETPISPEYPNDIALNLFVCGGTLFGRIDKAPCEVLSYAESIGHRLAPTKQGYAKCSVIPLRNALITADRSIGTSAIQNGIDVLLIEEGHVSLPPYPYGFLGGASGVSHDTVYFCGELNTHPDADKIGNFCRKHGYKTVSLSDEPLYDVGSILIF